VVAWWQGLKKGDKGLCLIAEDIYPIDVISHLPVLCEDKDTPYICVPSKHDLGGWRCSTRAAGLCVWCSCCCIKHHQGDSCPLSAISQS